MKVNIGIIVQLDDENWRKVEACLSEVADVVYVKRVPACRKLRITEFMEPMENKGDLRNGKFDYPPRET